MKFLQVPRWLMPDFTWPATFPDMQSKQLPPTPRLSHFYFRRFWGIVHWYLRSFSQMYCRWVGIKYDNQIAQLPFGLILKWSDGTRLEEVLTMQAIRTAGFPVPRVICYGEHPDAPHAPVSILMTRVPGDELGQVYEELTDEEKHSITQELKRYLETMRKWPNPWGGERICSLLGTTIRSIRIPMHVAGPFESEQEFNDFLIKASWAGGFASEAEFQTTYARAKKMQQIPHRVVFTHGDLKHHNIMVQNGRITGFLDWESAGWYPAYWDFTTALRFIRKGYWWYDFMMDLGAREYLVELDCERALTCLTSASYYW